MIKISLQTFSVTLTMKIESLIVLLEYVHLVNLSGRAQQTFGRAMSISLLITMSL